MTTTRTNLGPLTTPFTYPASCTLNVIQCSYCLVAWQAQTCSNNPNNAAGVQDNVNCWPPRATTSTFSTGVALNGWGIYSPGLSCPVGYNTACSATGTTVGGFQFQFPISAHETAVGCCPPNYTCSWGGSGDAQTCFSLASTGSFSAVQCSSGTSNAFSYYTVPSVATVTTTETTTASASGSSSASTITSTATNEYEFNTVTLFAPMFQLVHQASDLPSTSGGSSGTSPAQTGSHTSTTNLATGSASSSQLSTGAVAGIAVGSVVVGLALIGALVYLFLKQRKHKKQIAAYAPPPNLSGNTGLPPQAMVQTPMAPYSMQEGSYYGASTPMSMKSMAMQPSPVFEAAADTPRHELA
ncbi:hypothetical protein SEUCBS139899_001423 [Sporothrix eucalyptigena]|uniref:Uncharacterized protein n=1 Tax=Sporothrix eucalyptigena TaxID=1812306 RepID=A0ABP0B8Q7_9PEZI